MLGGVPLGTPGLCRRPSPGCAPCLPPDGLGWKLFYVTGCLFVAVQHLEDWEVSPAQAGRSGPRPASLPQETAGRQAPGPDAPALVL